MSLAKDFVDAAFRLDSTPALAFLPDLFRPDPDSDSGKTILPHLIKAYGLEELAQLVPKFDFATALK
mgnify:CR=1 FL=1